MKLVVLRYRRLEAIFNVIDDYCIIKRSMIH